MRTRLPAAHSSPSNHNHWGNNHTETAGRHLVKRVPTAHPEETVGRVLARLPGQSFDYAGAVYLVDSTQRLLGIVPMAKLLAAQGHQKLTEIATNSLPLVHPETDQERVASLAIHHGLSAAPVVDHNHRLLGVVPPQALIEVLRHEHVEDLHRLAGIRRENSRARHAMEAPPIRRVRDRLPWLLVGLLGSGLATWVVAWFEQALEARVAIAFFVPGIVYLADAIGTQTEAITVRGLSLSHASLRTLVAGELWTGFVMGLILGGLAFPFVWLGFSDLHLAFAVCLALVMAGTFSTTIGLLFPWFFSHLGKDPALGSGPIATILQDVLSLIVYFVIITLVVL